MLRIKKELNNQEWYEIQDSWGCEEQEITLMPSAVWSLKDCKYLVLQIDPACRQWGVYPSNGFKGLYTELPDARGKEEQARAKQWIQMVGLKQQRFRLRSEALQAVETAILLHGYPE